MKTLLIEKTTVGNNECEVIMLHDQENKRSSYVYTNEVNYQDWVNEQVNYFRNNGYKIFNLTELKLKGNNMRQFNNLEAVQIDNIVEANVFLQYLEDNTDLKWASGKKPIAGIKANLNKIEFPIFFEAYKGGIWFAKLEDDLEDETKIILLSEFIEP